MATQTEAPIYDLVVNDDGELVCTHPKAYIQPACCRPGQRLIECACQGHDSVVCPAVNCTGITDAEWDDLYVRLKEGSVR